MHDALAIHELNRAEAKTLYDYYRGKQKILERQKEVRAEINNKIVENRANEIVTFKTGYLVGEPVIYINKTDNEEYSGSVNALNEYMDLASKKNKDKKLVDWMHIAGVGVRMVLPYKDHTDDEAPFKLYSLSPMNNFVIYSSGIDHERMAGVRIVTKRNKKTVYSVWTKDVYYEIVEGHITNFTKMDEKTIPGQLHFYGNVPMIEYPLNEARLGSFEIVLPMLDAINTVASNRIDGIEQFIQALMVFCNCDIDEDTFKALKELGALKYKSDSNNPASVDILTQELNQMQTQTLVDYMYETILTICGMPNRNGGSSTSDTGTAVIMRDGWSAAEARAKDTENMFDESEKDFLRLVLFYLKTDNSIEGLRLKVITPKFTRRNYENINTKANVLVTMLGCNKIHPKLAFIACGLFADAEEAYAMSYKYYREEIQRKSNALLNQVNATAQTGDNLNV